MRKPHPLMLLLGLATIVVDTAIYRVWLASHAWLVEFALWALLFSHNDLLWIWACLGTTRTSIRVSAAMIGMVAFVGTTSLFSGHADWELSTALFVMAAGIVVLLGPSRLSGWQIALRDEGVNPRPPLQFSLRSAMEGITGFAILLALAKIVYSRDPDSYYLLRAIPWFVMIGLSFAIIARLAVWVVFGKGSVVLRWIVFVLAAWLLSGGPTAFLVISALAHRSAEGIPVQAALVVGSLTICRLRGYRFVRRGQMPGASLPNSHDSPGASAA